MQTNQQASMARGRALLTETEREQLAGEHGQQRKYEAVSRARSRMNHELTQDMELFAEHHPDLLDELREIVCREN